MRSATLLLIIVTSLISLNAEAQSATAHHRAIYQKINAGLKTMKKVSATHQDDATTFSLTGWMENGEVKKIVAKTGDDGDGFEEYYLENEKPLFVFSSYSKAAAEGALTVTVEERLYFKEGHVFQWLTTEKPAPVFHGEDYAATTERLVGNCTQFVRALRGGNQTPSVQKTEGLLTGIEEGDYFHWNMKKASGEEVSFFILKADASVDQAVENAASRIGQKCRVTWKKSRENIPEAGGVMEVEQILSVEWLGQ